MYLITALDRGNFLASRDRPEFAHVAKTGFIHFDPDEPREQIACIDDGNFKSASNEKMARIYNLLICAGFASFCPLGNGQLGPHIGSSGPPAPWDTAMNLAAETAQVRVEHAPAISTVRGAPCHLLYRCTGIVLLVRDGKLGNRPKLAQ